MRTQVALQLLFLHFRGCEADVRLFSGLCLTAGRYVRRTCFAAQVSEQSSKLPANLLARAVARHSERTNFSFVGSEATLLYCIHCSAQHYSSAVYHSIELRRNAC